MYADVKLIAKMAAAVRQIGRWRPIFNGPIFLQIRTATKRQRQLEEHKRNDDVFLLNYRTSPSHTFIDAMSALRAYAINGERQTVELQMKINMGENKVNHSCDKSFLSANDSDQREFFVFYRPRSTHFMVWWCFQNHMEKRGSCWFLQRYFLETCVLQFLIAILITIVIMLSLSSLLLLFLLL